MNLCATALLVSVDRFVIVNTLLLLSFIMNLAVSGLNTTTSSFKDLNFSYNGFNFFFHFIGKDFDNTFLFYLQLM